jgi:hypothetical protein
VVVALFLWFIEVTLHVLVFRTGNFIEELFALHDPNELWMRIIVVTVVLFAGSIYQHMANKITKAYEKEREITDKLEASNKEIGTKCKLSLECRLARGNPQSPGIINLSS